MSVRGWLKGRSGLCAVAGLALVLRLVVFIAGRPWTEEVVRGRVLFNPSDALGYHNLALKILTLGTIDAVGTLRTPGYPAFIAAFYTLSGPRPWIVLLAQTFIGAVTSVIIYFTARRFFGKGTALAAGLLFAIDPYSIFYTTTLTTETWFTFLVALAVLLLLTGIDGGRLTVVGGAGLAAGVACLVRPIAQYFPLVMVGVIFVSTRVALSFRIKACVVAFLCFGVAVTPWVLRNGLSKGAFALSSLGGYNLLLYNAGATEAQRTGKELARVQGSLLKRAIAAGANPTMQPDEETFANERVYRSVAGSYISEHRADFATEYLRGCARMFLHSSVGDVGRGLGQTIRQAFAPRKTGHGLARPDVAHWGVAGAIYAYLLFTYLAFLFGLIALLRRRELRASCTFLFVIAYFVLLTGHAGSSRLKVPIIPFFAPVAAYGLCASISPRRRALIERGGEEKPRSPAPRGTDDNRRSGGPL